MGIHADARRRRRVLRERGLTEARCRAAALDPGEWPRAISGGPETLDGLLDQLADRVGVDEVMIQHVVADHDDALRSHELLAEGAGLDPR